MDFPIFPSRRIDWEVPTIGQHLETYRCVLKLQGTTYLRAPDIHIDVHPLHSAKTCHDMAFCPDRPFPDSSDQQDHMLKIDNPKLHFHL